MNFNNPIIANNMPYNGFGMISLLNFNDDIFLFTVKFIL